MQKALNLLLLLELVITAAAFLTENLYILIGVFLIGLIALAVSLILSVQNKRRHSAMEELNRNTVAKKEYDELLSQLDELKLRFEEKSAEVNDLRESTAILARGHLRVQHASEAQKTLSNIINQKTEESTLELTDHVYSLGKLSQQLGELIQRVLGELTSETGGLREQSNSLEKELLTIEDLIEQTRIIKDDYIKELEMTEKAMKLVDDLTITITDISERTHLLAVNASIEAARAGKTGSGFAVIATEIQDLARNTMSIANEMSSTIEKSVKTVNESIHVYGDRLAGVVNSLSESGRQHSEIIARLSPQIDKVGGVIEHSNQLSNEVTENINEITVHLQYQDAVRQILEHLVHIVEVVSSQNVSQAREQVELSEEDLQNEERQVEQQLKQFFTTREEWEAFGHRVEEKSPDSNTSAGSRLHEMEGDVTLFS